MKRFLLAALAALMSTAALAADLPLKAGAVPYVYNNPCTITNCSGFYAGGSLFGTGSNLDITGLGIQGSVFAAGGALDLHAGYQFWNGQFFAAFELGLGYQFPAATSGVVTTTPFKDHILGEELVKVGVALFTTSVPATTVASQAPIPINIPAAFANPIPYFVFGGLQTQGKTVWANGAGFEEVLAAHFNIFEEYLYAPAQQGLPATQLVRLGLNYHF